MWSDTKSDSVLIPTRSGLPRRVATHSPGKCLDLKAQAKAPSSCMMVFSTSSLKLAFGWSEYRCFNNLAITSVSVSDSNTKPLFSRNTYV